MRGPVKLLRSPSFPTSSFITLRDIISYISFVIMTTLLFSASQKIIPVSYAWVHSPIASRISSTLSKKFFSRCTSQLSFASSSTRRYSTTPIVESSTESLSESKAPRKFKSFPFEYHEEILLQIEDLTNLGLGVGRVQLADGKKWVVMVPTVLPGEEVRVKIFRNHDSYSEADLVEVIKPSNDRVTPLCPYFQQCGGCQYQHMNISAQRQWKQLQVQSLLQRIAGLPQETTSKVNPVVGSDDLYHYRSKISPHYDVPPKSHFTSPQGKDKNILKIGFQQRNSRIIVDIDQCIIATKEINDKYRDVRDNLNKKFSQPDFQRPKYGATLLFRHADDDYICTDHREVIQQTVKDVSFRFKAGEFFQNNPYVLPLMIDHVLKYAIDPQCQFLVDAYCGSGLFALHGASHFKEVYGVEVSDLAVKAAQDNAKRNNIENVSFMCASSEAIFSKIQHLPPQNTVMIIDPPRKGCDELFLNQLFAFKPFKVVYVSCDPATQARDAKAITANGYNVVDITPFDLFPQTRHIENVMVFQLKQGN